MLKRTNWTNEEVIEILEGEKRFKADGSEDEYCKIWNAGIDSAKWAFYDFIRPEDEFGAMAYETDDKQIYHIGKVPDEDWSNKRK